jgi:hypothetical protein
MSLIYAKLNAQSSVLPCLRNLLLKFCKAKNVRIEIDENFSTFKFHPSSLVSITVNDEVTGLHVF